MPTTPPAGTPGRCWRPREPRPLAGAPTRVRLTSDRGQRQAAVASGFAASRRNGATEGTAIHGTARLGRKTKDLVKRLGPGDIAVIDHTNIDRIAAEELIATGVRAVINTVGLLQRALSELRSAAADRSRDNGRRRAPLGAVRDAQGRRPADDRGRDHPQRRRGDPHRPGPGGRGAGRAARAPAPGDRRGPGRLRREHGRPRARRGRPADRRHRLPRRPGPASATATS